MRNRVPFILAIMLLLMVPITLCAADPATAQAPPWYADPLALILGGLAAILTAGKKIPGVAGMLAAIGEALWSLFAPASYKRAEAKRAVAADGLLRIVGLIQRMPNDGTIGDLKSKIRAKAPASVVDYINELVAELEKTEGPLVMPLALATTDPAPVPPLAAK